MTRFTAPLDCTVYLHDEAGEDMGMAEFRCGRWTAPDEAHAEALRRAHVYGVVEVGGGVEGGVEPTPPPSAPAPAAKPRTRKPGRLVHGAITAAHRPTEED